MIIDAHHHLWQIGRNGHQWPTPDLAPIYRDFVEADLIRTLDGTGVDATVLIQSQPNDIDTAWMLEIACQSPHIKAVVGWVDFTAPDASAQVRALSQKPKLRGLRPMLQGLEDDWSLNPAFDPVFAAMIDCDLTFDALVYTRHLRAIDTLARRYPTLNIVIDHAAKPPLAHSDPQAMHQWRDALGRVAQNDNVWCKLSGLLTEMPEHARFTDFTPCADEVLERFGPSRLIWGSDWPVSLLKVGYSDWLNSVRKWLSPLGAADQAQVMGTNAIRFYRLDQETN